MVCRFAPAAPLGLATVAVALMGFSGSRYRAGINPTVASHLEYAGTAAREGRTAEAGGYAQALLIGEEITYALAVDPASEPHRASATAALEAAAQTWRTALDGSVTIRPARPGETPNLVIHFEPDVQIEGHPVSGYIKWRREIQRSADGRWTGSFEGQVFARTAFRGKPMTVDAMRCCLGHEMGHMFGLPDSPPNGETGIMGPLNMGRPMTEPSETEIETVRRIRSDAAEIGRMASAGEMRQAIIELEAAGNGCDHAHARE